MKRLKVLAITASAFFSCTQFDPTNVSKLGEELISSSINYDTIKIESFLSDSAKGYFSEIKQEVKGYLKNSKNLKFKIIKTDTSEFDDGDKFFSTYFLSDNEIHRLECNYIRNENNVIRINSLSLANLTKDCNQYYKEVYKPSEFVIQPQGIVYSINNFRISQLSIKFRNSDIVTDYSNLKFRLKIFRDNEEIINRTVIIKDTIHAGDNFEYDIADLRGIYVNPILTSKNSTHEVEFISSNHPANEECVELTEIQKFLKKKR